MKNNYYWSAQLLSSLGFGNCRLPYFPSFFRVLLWKLNIICWRVLVHPVTLVFRDNKMAELFKCDLLLQPTLWFIYLIWVFKNASNYSLPLCISMGIVLLIVLFWLCITMELFTITNVCGLLFHFEVMIDVDSFRIRSIIYIIQEWYQVKEVFMEHLNNFNILVGVQTFTALLKIKNILIPVQHLKNIKCAVTVILCVALDEEIQSSGTK